MKKKFLFLMTLLAVSLLALAEMTIYVYKKDGTKVPFVAVEVDSIGFINTQGMHNNYIWVDLGLPSGVKWASVNVGGSSPEDVGDYFAWGEIESKSDFTEVNYVYEDVPEVLPISADAANVNWGGSWRMPTDNDVKELNRNTKCEIITYNGVECVKITSKINGSSILVPRGQHIGLFWTSNGSYTLIGYSKVVWRGHLASFDDGELSIPVTAPYYGKPIRPVLP